MHNFLYILYAILSMSGEKTILIRNNIMYTEKAGIQITKNENKYGLISDSETILSMEYDNIFIYGMYLYVLHKGGKIGTIQFNDTDLSYKVIADTNYDTLDFYWHDLLFSGGNASVYYFSHADQKHSSINKCQNLRKCPVDLYIR